MRESFEEGEFCGNGGVFSAGGERMGRVFRGCDSDGEGRASSRGLELVPFFRVSEGFGSGGGGLLEEAAACKHLGWVQDLVDDRVAVSNGLFSPLAVREPVGSWNGGENLAYGLSQDEVSK